MNSIYIDRSSFNRNQKVKVDSLESNLYYKNGIIYKFLKPSYIFKKDTIVEALHKDPITNAANPINKIINPSSLSFCGYTMHYYEGFETLDSYLFSKPTYKYEERKKACLSIISTINEMFEKGYLYYDIHTKNILYKQGSIVFVDMDSMCNYSLGVNENDTCFKKKYKSPETVIKSLTLYLMLSLMLPYHYDSINLSCLRSRYKHKDPLIDAFLFTYSTIRYEELIKNGEYTLESAMEELNEETVDEYITLAYKR